MTDNQVQKDLSRLAQKVERVEAIKQDRPRSANGFPSNSEGRDGDEQIRLTSDGVRLYKKFRGKWYYTSLVSQ